MVNKISMIKSWIAHKLIGDEHERKMMKGSRVFALSLFIYMIVWFALTLYDVRYRNYAFDRDVDTYGLFLSLSHHYELLAFMLLAVVYYVSIFVYYALSYNHMCITPQSKNIITAPQGFNCLELQIASDGFQIFRSPISETPCVWFDLKIKGGKVNSNNSMRDEIVLAQTAQDELVLLELEGCNIHGLAEREYQIYIDKNNPYFLVENPGYYWVEEMVMLPGSRVKIYGHLQSYTSSALVQHAKVHNKVKWKGVLDYIIKDYDVSHPFANYHVVKKPKFLTYGFHLFLNMDDSIIFRSIRNLRNVFAIYSVLMICILAYSASLIKIPSVCEGSSCLVQDIKELFSMNTQANHKPVSPSECPCKAIWAGYNSIGVNLLSEEEVVITNCWITETELYLTYVSETQTGKMIENGVALTTRYSENNLEVAYQQCGVAYDIENDNNQKAVQYFEVEHPVTPQTSIDEIEGCVIYLQQLKAANLDRCN